MGTQVWTLTVSEAVVGGKQRGPSGSSRRHSVLWSSLCRIQAVAQVWEPETVPGPGHQRRGPTGQLPADFVRPTGHRVDGLGTFQHHRWPGFLKQALSCGPFDSRLCKFLVVSHPQSSYRHGASCVHVTYLAHHSVLTCRHLRTFPDEKGLCRVDVDWLGTS